MKKFILLLSTAYFIAVIASSPVEPNKGKQCDVGHKILQDGEVGAAPLGDCFDVRCVNGALQPLIACGLIKVDEGCPPAVEDVTKLYPECCGNPHC